MRPQATAWLLLLVIAILLISAAISVRWLYVGLRGRQRHHRGPPACHRTDRGAGPIAGRRAELLPAISRENELEAAYLLDANLRPAPGGGGSGLSISLLRIDPDRAMRALEGQNNIGPAYGLEDASRPSESVSVLAGYFRVPGEPARLLVLEAGSAFSALPTRLRPVRSRRGATVIALAALCVLLVLFGLRAARREQLLRAEARADRRCASWRRWSHTSCAIRWAPFGRAPSCCASKPRIPSWSTTSSTRCGASTT